MYPFRLGTTSYIIPDDILPNAHFLADKVQDIELVLFEVDDGPQSTGNLPSPETVAQLAALAAAHGLTFTVHLPLDLRLGEDGDESHILHLDGRDLLPSPVGASPTGEAAQFAGWGSRPGSLTPSRLPPRRRLGGRPRKISRRKS